VGRARGASALLDAHLDRTRARVAAAVADPASADISARALVGALALSLEASLIARHSPAAVADAFIAGRLGDEPAAGALFGALPSGVDVAAVAARA
jgi:putative acyl-CoA dehydrogenase